MTAITLASLLLGSGGLLTGAWAIYTQLRDRPRAVKKQESDLEKQHGEIELTQELKQLIAAEAAKLNSDERIEAERWWSEQIESLRADLREEAELARNARREVNRLVAWADTHQMWDRQAWRKAIESDPQFPPPPQLEHGPPLPGNGNGTH
jgi:hypothetical protein